MPRPISLFDPYTSINQAYGKLRELAVPDFAEKGRASSINHFAVGFVREIAAEVLDADIVKLILAPYGGRGAWESANLLLKFTPKLVESVISSGKLTEAEFARRIGDEDAFLAFAEKEKANPGNRGGGSKAKTI